MPPKKDIYKYVDKNMNKEELTQIAKFINVFTENLKTKPEILKAIRSVDPPLPKKYNLYLDKWSTAPDDQTMPATDAQTAEEQEDPRNDAATDLQKVYRGKKGRETAKV